MASSTTTSDILPQGWTFSTALKLGRVSNLPTVWTNVLAAVILSGAEVSVFPVAGLLLAMSLAYVGGMYLNDAFDQAIDAVERPSRPIPLGLVSGRSVFIAGFTLLALSLVCVVAIAMQSANVLPATISGILLCGCIIGYNAWHKNNPISPLLMGMCRLFVYSTCALSISAEPSSFVYLGAMMTLAYLIGLTYTAKQEHLDKVSSWWPLAFLAAPILFGLYFAPSSYTVWASIIVTTVWISYCLRWIIRRNAGDVPKAVTGLIAGIALVDMVLITVAGTMTSDGVSIVFSTLPFVAFGLTLFFQRYIAGT